MGRFDYKLSAILSDVLPVEVETPFNVGDDGFFVGQLQTRAAMKGTTKWLNLLLQYFSGDSCYDKIIRIPYLTKFTLFFLLCLVTVSPNVVWRRLPGPPSAMFARTGEIIPLEVFLLLIHGWFRWQFIQLWDISCVDK